MTYSEKTDLISNNWSRGYSYTAYTTVWRFGVVAFFNFLSHKIIFNLSFLVAKKDPHKRASCKALIMANAYSNVVMDKIEECIKSSLYSSNNGEEEW